MEQTFRFPTSKHILGPTPLHPGGRAQVKGPPPPRRPPGALISMFRTLLCTCSKGAIAAHQFIQEEAKNSRRTGFSRPAHRAVFSARVIAQDIHWTPSLWKTATERVEAQAACLGSECGQLFSIPPARCP